MGDRPSAGHEQSSQEGEMLRGLTATRATRASGRGTLQVVAATTPQFKSTKHHQRSRPKKTRPSEKRKGATKYENFLLHLQSTRSCQQRGSPLTSKFVEIRTTERD